MGRKLPKYDNYIEKLSLYCRASEIAIEHKEYDGDGAYVPTRRKIILDRDLDESTEVAVLLHECGHMLDDALNDPIELKKLDKAYMAFYKNEANDEQKELVYACEERAWNCGRAVAKKLRIKLGNWYDEEELISLADYRDEAENEQN